MKISQSTFTIVANGFADGPAQPLRDYLLEHKAKKVIMVNHPLVAEGSNKHLVTTYEKGKLVSQKKYALPNRPPYTFGLDPFVPLKLPDSTAWFGFNNLATLRGLRRKKRGKVQLVYYWAVDFVPNRFGNNPLTKIYNKVDKNVSTNADARIELAQAAVKLRADYLGLDTNKMAPTLTVPMGTWLDRTPKAKDTAWQRKKIVYLGHLVERQGVATLVKALGIIMKQDPDVTADIVGGGPLLDDLKALAKELGIAKCVTFHGFVKEHQDVEAILASGTVAAAPYVKDETSFTQFADPGKLKAYLGASLPIVLTDVPPNAHELEKAGAAIIVKDSPQAVADGLSSLLSDQAKWNKAHKAAAKLAQEFDWNHLLGRALAELGFE
ncbi:MAG: glycosyltransferase [Patescibacteria group bacterium]